MLMQRTAQIKRQSQSNTEYTPKLMRASDKPGKTFFRSGERVFCLNGQWYFQTREHDHGPFNSEHTANLELGRYVSEMQHFAAVLDGSDRLLGAPRPAPTHTSELRLVEPGEY